MVGCTYQHGRVFLLNPIYSIAGLADPSHAVPDQNPADQEV